MGNFASCPLGNPQTPNNPKTTEVILPNGDIKQIKKHPIKAAELMLEAPNHFIVNSKSLKIDRKFSPLNADDTLQKANVYVLFPMYRKNSLVKASDLDGLIMTKNSTIKRVTGRKVKVRPERCDDKGPKTEATTAMESLPKLSFEGVEEVEFMHRVSMSRSKKPLLETIHEEPKSGRFNVVGGRFSI